MKFSKYTASFLDGNKTFLFSFVTERIIAIESSLSKVLIKYEDNIDMLRNVHPELHKSLSNAKIIIPENLDETKSLIDLWKQQDRSPKFFGIIINPTLNCNLRCWYCYEEHSATSNMSVKTLESIKQLIEQKTQESELENLNVSFFGGEPLLSFNNVVLPILQYASECCYKKGIKLYSNFTTNAVLLTDMVLEKTNIIKLSSPATFQITFDGNREIHDKIRHGAKNEGTYDRILMNTIKALKNGNPVHVRFNYTHENILTFFNVLDDFLKIEEKYRTYLFFNFQQVWQDSEEHPDAKKELKQIKEAFEKAGFNVDTDVIHYRHKCYADLENHVVVNYNGDVFKCTARNFSSENREGVLNDKGIILWNKQYENRMKFKYTNKACLECSIMPICNGGCTQNKLDSCIINGCYRYMTDDDKEQYAYERFKEIMNSK